MIKVPVESIDGKLQPSSPIPPEATNVVCDGKNYTAYEKGDELPPEPQEQPSGKTQPIAADKG